VVLRRISSICGLQDDSGSTRARGVSLNAASLLDEALLPQSNGLAGNSKA